jgi:hypothetical protein
MVHVLIDFEPLDRERRMNRADLLKTEMYHLNGQEEFEGWEIYQMSPLK